MGIVGIGQGYSCAPKTGHRISFSNLSALLVDAQYGNGASKNVKKTKCLQVRGLIVGHSVYSKQSFLGTFGHDNPNLDWPCA